MGKIFSTVFGGSGSKQKSSQQAQSTNSSQSVSWNDAFPALQKAYAPTIERGNNAIDFVSRLLGLGGSSEADTAFEDYQDSSGFDFIMDSGRKAIEGSAASKGMLNSGATAKALTQFGQNTGSHFLNSFLDRLLGLSDQGFKAGSLVGSAGQKSFGDSQGQSTSSGFSKGSSYSKPGMGAFLGQVASGLAASDRRLKTDIIRLRTLDNGIGVYRFVYKDDPSHVAIVGVMADEVGVVQPEALGPVVNGYATVDYDKIKGWRH